MTRLEADWPGRFPAGDAGRDLLRESIAQGFRNTGYTIEFKVARGCERVMMDVDAGVVVRPPQGQQPAFDILLARFTEVFTQAWLNAHDDNGNLI